MSEAQRHLQRPPSWAQADMPPPEGAWCATTRVDPGDP